MKYKAAFDLAGTELGTLALLSSPILLMGSQIQREPVTSTEPTESAP